MTSDGRRGELPRSELPRSELPRPAALDRIGPHGTPVLIEASADELPAIAARLGIPAVHALRCAFKLRRIGGSVIEAQGELVAGVTQLCVVSLDEFDGTVQEAFTVHLVPEGTEDDDPEPDAIDQVPFQGSAIDLGEAAVEQLALALDPYPRKPGAALPEGAGEPDLGAFASLGALKGRH